ncbi:MAG: phosphoribosylformylglycinamidine synthase subunit PurQ, partial [Treponema sp.]|nr:phosphoribosylformylglycinamidine synthase subunit PurQ [Treponema sp.]
GNYLDEGSGLRLAVPPTLVCFAAGTVRAEKVRSGALSGKAGNIIVLLSQSPASGGPGEDEWDRFKFNMETLKKFAASGALRAAYPVGQGGAAASLALMAFGNMTGVEAFAEAFAPGAGEQGSVLAELEGDPAEFPGVLIAGLTLGEPVFRLGEAEVPLAVLRRAYEYPLAQVYPQTSTGATAAEPPEAPGGGDGRFPGGLAPQLYTPTNTHFHTHNRTHTRLSAAPLAVLPVFPGTNCEWDMERAFREAGGRTRLVIFRNRTGEDIRESIGELEAAIAEAQIFALSGGFSAGDEPDGSGKFIANVLRSPAIAEALTAFLEKRDGLILGICNGFQALIKTGLVPYGGIRPASETAPTLTFNAIGRHVSRMVRTRVMPSSSPWLSLEEPGRIHLVPVSHGEGRLSIGTEEGEALFAAGQVPFCYADAGGNPTMAEPDNPNGSAFAAEALTSPDGRVLGKMAHSERCGELVHINIPGNKKQRIFEAGVNYFL